MRIEVDERRVTEALNALIQRSMNLRQPLQELGEYLIVSTKQRFDEQAAPDGTPWAANSPVTLSRKRGTDPLTGETRRLRDEIHYAIHGDDELEWGSSMDYAAMQHFGGRKSEHPHLWGDIPARPFLGLSDDDEDEIIDTLRDWLEGAI